MDKLENDILRIETTPFSASLHSLIYKPFQRELTLSLKTEEDHCSHPSYSGCTIFPFAGRIERGIFNGTKFDRNDGLNSLHGGREARNAVFDKIESTSYSTAYRKYRRRGEDGIESDRVYTVTYSVDGNSLMITHEMESGKPVLCDTTCHLYFNLGSSSDILSHRIKLDENAIVLNNTNHIPLTITPTKGTPFDLNSERVLEEVNSLEDFSFSNGLNNAFRLSGEKRLLLKADDLMMSATSSSQAVVLYGGGYLERKAAYIAVEFEDVPFQETRTVTDHYRRTFSYTFLER